MCPTLIPNTELKSSMIMWRSSICLRVFFTPLAEYIGGRFNGGDGINISNCKLSNRLWHTSFILDMDNCINLSVWYSVNIFKKFQVSWFKIKTKIKSFIKFFFIFHFSWFVETEMCSDDWFVTLMINLH